MFSNDICMIFFLLSKLAYIYIYIYIYIYQSFTNLQDKLYPYISRWLVGFNGVSTFVSYLYISRFFRGAAIFRSFSLTLEGTSGGVTVSKLD